MNTLALIFTALVALEHLYIAYIEMFSWTNVGKRVFGRTMRAELFGETTGLAANLGLYNGFLAVGLILSFVVGSAEISLFLRYLFLAFVAIAAIFGAIRSDRSILLKQGLPAFLAIIFSLLS